MGVCLPRWHNHGLLRSRAGIAREAVLILAALAAVLILERGFAKPVFVPGTSSVVLYTTAIYEPWHVRGALLVGMACVAYVAGWLLWRLVRTVQSLHEEGAI